MFKRDRIQHLLSGLLCLGFILSAIAFVLLKRQSETVVAKDWVMPERDRAIVIDPITQAVMLEAIDSHPQGD
jgi:hypothetical protein